MSQTKINVGMIDGSGSPGSGNFLRGDGAWEAAGGGAWTLIGTQVASSSASLTQTGITSTYDTYAIALSDIKATSDGDAFQIRFGTSAGINSTTNYRYHAAICNTGSTSYVGDRWDGASIRMGASGVGNDTGEGLGGLLYIHRPTDGTQYPFLSGTYVSVKNDAVPEGGHVIGVLRTVIALDRVYVWLDGGITSGRMTVWGISHA